MFSVENLPNTRGDTSLIKKTRMQIDESLVLECDIVNNFTFQHLSRKVAWGWDCAICDEYFQRHIGRRNTIGNYEAFVNVECMLTIYIVLALNFIP